MVIKSNDRQVLQRMDSDTTMRMLNNDKGFCGVCRVIVERSWSGNLGPPPSNKPKRPPFQMVENKNSEKQHRRFGSTGDVSNEGVGIEPKLVRSGGLRRDWSFENLYLKGQRFEPEPDEIDLQERR